MRLVFAGTPQAAVPSLRVLLESDHDVVAVITRPDAPAGRGRSLTPSPVAQLAAEHDLHILKPPTLRDSEFQSTLRALAPQVCPVVAYGAMVPPPVLEIAPHGWINLHFSLLPAWRGAAPVQHAIWHGDQITGASTFRLDAGLDTGPVFGVVTAAIDADATAGSLLDELSESGAQLLLKTIDGIEAGQVVAVPQPAEGVSLAPKITVEDAGIDWTLPAQAVDRMIRACTPAPGAWTTFADARVKVGPVQFPVDVDIDAEPGQLHITRRNVLVGTATGPVVLTSVRPAGKREMAAADWARGLRLESGVAFG